VRVDAGGRVEAVVGTGTKNPPGGTRSVVDVVSGRVVDVVDVVVLVEVVVLVLVDVLVLVLVDVLVDVLELVDDVLVLDDVLELVELLVEDDEELLDVVVGRTATHGKKVVLPVAVPK
jgi:hypothetical protein